MVLENFCKNCGKRILPNQPYCPNCGNRTSYNDMDSEYILTIPIHNIGFFNFDIDFSPYINNIRRNFKYEICGCGFLNEKSNDFCPMCGTKRVNNRFYNLFKPKRDKNYLDNVLCDCGTINSKENSFCENCGNQLKKDEIHTFNNNYSNFNIEFDESVFCFCGQENEKNALFCTKCGRPIKSCGKNDDLNILCACSTLNEITSDYCIGCGADLKNIVYRPCYCILLVVRHGHNERIGSLIRIKSVFVSLRRYRRKRQHLSVQRYRKIIRHELIASPVERLYRYGKRQLIDLLTVRKSHEYRRLSVGRRRYPLIRYDPCKALLYAVRIGELRVDDISLIKLLILSEGFKLRRYVASCVGSRRDIRRISVFGYADVGELFLSRYLREAYAKPEGLVVGCPCMCFLPSENIGRYYIVYRPSGVVGAVTLQLYREYLGPIIYRT